MSCFKRYVNGEVFPIIQYVVKFTNKAAKHETNTIICKNSKSEMVFQYFDIATISRTVQLCGISATDGSKIGIQKQRNTADKGA